MIELIPVNAETKTCPYCTETIRLEAKVCPRCRQWLTFRSWSHPAIQPWYVIAPFLIAAFVMGLMLIIKLEETFYPRPLYSEALHPLQVTDSKMVFNHTELGMRIYLIGTITNRSGMEWNHIQFECRFYDTNNVMVDVAHPSASFTAQPQDEAAFSLGIKPSRATNDYSTFSLKVVTADRVGSL